MAAITVATASLTLVALGIGVALAGAPGPVQAVLVTEALRGGHARGFRVLIGVHVTFATLLLCVALGLSIDSPRGVVLRLLKIVGGCFVIWLGFDGLRSGVKRGHSSKTGRDLPPVARGALAILLNPGGWVFLATVASPLMATAAREDGTLAAVVAAVALVVGAALGDAGLVFVSGTGLRRGGERLFAPVQVGLAVLLCALGIWLVLDGVAG